MQAYTGETDYGEGEVPRGRITMQSLAMPADTNANGDIFGGWLMAQMDLGSSVLARSRARGRVATIVVDSMKFHRPVHVGDLVSIHSEMLKEGTTSMQIGVEVWITRQPSEEHVKVTEAVFTFVAIDENGVKRPLP
ncbi:acyl-CoA thioesterase [Rhodovulum sp. DZ06]|uniref:acyl-CoA thioesterase n=1 Tax=Rhodovulum sp. DZ06 TaxID=3425126 RepID=UPI003D33C27A